MGNTAGLSSSVTDQLQQILIVVGTALKGVTSSHVSSIRRQVREKEYAEMRNVVEKQRRNEILQGTWHDGRLDCVAGNGVMSELGFGDEPMFESDGTGPTQITNLDEKQGHGEETARKERTREEMEAVRALPIVMIRNYEVKAGSSREELLTVLAQWAATLAENQVCLNFPRLCTNLPRVFCSLHISL